MATAVLTRTKPAASRSPLAIWHLTSLDAPCVAALWTAFLSHQFRLSEPATVPLALGLAVWLLYAADRVRDATQGDGLEERHRFHQAHRKSFLVAGAAAAALLTVLVVHLPHALREGWLVLAIPLCVYAIAVHVLQLHRFAKEPLVALLFAAGVAMPLAVQHSTVGNQLLPVAVAFASLCWLNCIAIARWEQALLSADRCTAWLGRHFNLAIAFAVCVALPLLRSRQTAAIGFAAVGGALCLLALDTSRKHLTRTAVRAMADAALLTPVVIWPLLARLTGR